MRDAFGEIDPDEIDTIDFVEPDASAFAEPDDSAVSIVPGRRRWVIPIAIASAVGLAAAGLMVWSPWREDNTASFPNRDTPELTLTDELVFDTPPAELTAASLGSATEEDTFSSGFANAEGYFFAEPGVSWDILGDGASDGTWAAFYAVRQSDHDDGVDTVDMEVGDRDTAGTVQGAPAVVGPVDGGIREIRFGPVAGWMFSSVTSGMSLTESLNFAEAVGVDDGVPTLSDDGVIGDMLPIGDMADYEVAISTMLGASSPFGMQPGIVSVHYGDFAADEGAPTYSIATEPVIGDTTLAMLRFTIDGEEGHSVHGLPAIVAEDIQTGFGVVDRTSSLAAWVEGGRLVVVTGPDGVEATLALAETVRPATDDEWVEVVAIAQNPIAPSIPLFPDDTTTIDFGNGVTLYEGVDAETGDTFALKVDVAEDGALSICAEQQSAGTSESACDAESFVELPLLLATDHTTGRQFVLAIVERGLGEDAELRITLADGTIETFPLVEVSADLPGLAVATVLPADHGAVELWIGAKLVRTL